MIHPQSVLESWLFTPSIYTSLSFALEKQESSKQTNKYDISSKIDKIMISTLFKRTSGAPSTERFLFTLFAVLVLAVVFASLMAWPGKVWEEGRDEGESEEVTWFCCGRIAECLRCAG